MTKLPSTLALLVSIMSIFAGGMVIRGWRPGYSVLSWLPVYNFVVGLLSLLPAYLLWVNSRYAMIAVIGTFSIHTIVLLLLLTIFRSNVAFQSIAAMIFRLVVWIAILALMFFQARRAM